jgi:excisionase family DNA binding protein
MNLKDTITGKSDFLSVSQLAQVLKISRVAVLKRINRGAIKAIKVGRSFVIRKKDIDIKKLMTAIRR